MNYIEKKYRFFIIILLPFFIIAIVFFIIKKPTIDILNNTDFIISNFTDSLDGGNSSCAISKTKSSYEIEFMLQQGYEYPYAGIQIQKRNGELFDISGYTFKIEFKSFQDIRMSIRINQYIQYYSNHNNPLSWIIYMKTFGVKKGINNLIFRSEDIREIPEWWFIQNPKMKEKTHSLSYTQTQSIWLLSESSIPLNTTVNISISDFKLVYNNFSFIIISSISTLLYFIILFLIWKIKKEVIKYIYIPIQHLEIEDKEQKKYKDILSYIGKNYHNPNLKIVDISRKIGVSDDSVSNIIKQFSSYNFRQYLNKIRLEEAKKLLRETNLQISEIAFSVGYNNVQHFNRIFKTETGLSPTEFREQQA